jgi:hypothetical protein
LFPAAGASAPSWLLDPHAKAKSAAAMNGKVKPGVKFTGAMK